MKIVEVPRTNCKNCCAPLVDGLCPYCGTRYFYVFDKEVEVCAKVRATPRRTETFLSVKTDKGYRRICALYDIEETCQHQFIDDDRIYERRYTTYEIDCKGHCTHDEADHIGVYCVGSKRDYKIEFRTAGVEYAINGAIISRFSANDWSVGGEENWLASFSVYVPGEITETQVKPQ